MSNGILDTGNNRTLTVTGEFDHTGGTFVSNSSTVAVRNLVITNTSSTTFNAPDGSGMLNITGEGNSGSGDGYAFRRVSGAFVDNTGTVTFKTPTTTQIRMGTAGQDFYNVIIDESSAGGLFYVNDEGFTVTNDLTLTDGDFDTGLGTTAPLIDIQGDLTIGANNTFGGITATQTGNISFGSLTIASGGTYSATSGTTTITGGKSSSGYSFQNAGTFTHNKGKIKLAFTPSQNWYCQCNEYYDFELAYTENYYCMMEDQSGNAITILGDLTISQGLFDVYANADSLTVHGLTTNAGTIENYANQDTGKITHHGLVTNTGTYKINDGTTVKMNGGIRQLGTLTIS